ncbi:MAG: gamma-glutamyl-phosphate reductase, partial [Terrimicrobiaceae bacterium]
MSSTLENEIHTIGRRAREASRTLARLSGGQKNKILIAMADELVVHTPAILSANAEDVAAAEKNGLAKAAIDRLRLTADRVAAMADGLRQVAALADPVGEILRDW